MEDRLFIREASWITKRGIDSRAVPVFRRDFDCRGVSGIAIEVRGYAHGIFDVRAAFDGPVLGSIQVQSSNVWERYEVQMPIPDGVHGLWLAYRGGGTAQLKTVGFLGGA